MRRLLKSTWIAVGAVALVACWSGIAAAGQACDEYDPFGPSRSATVKLGPGDFLTQDKEELRSFVATGSIGKVQVSVISSTPAGIVSGVSAVPEISMLSPHYGEQLKGINIAVTVAPSRRPVSVVLNLRQVCAKHFRNTFLYY
jgi:hypothetical protein